MGACKVSVLWGAGIAQGHHGCRLMTGPTAEGHRVASGLPAGRSQAFCALASRIAVRTGSALEARARRGIGGDLARSVMPGDGPGGIAAVALGGQSASVSGLGTSVSTAASTCSSVTALELKSLPTVSEESTTSEPIS